MFAQQTLLVALQLIKFVAAAAFDLSPQSVALDLQGIVRHPSAVAVRQRWSEFEPPDSVVIVNATCESDIKAVVKYCNKNGVSLLPQSGGNGWASFKAKSKSTSVILNLAGLNQVTVSADKKSVAIGGGAIISDVIAAADAAGVLVMSGNCPCVGALGAGLGGGFGNMIGELGMVADNIRLLRVVTPEGEAINVSPNSNSDLFWAMRGAGPNFGVVTYATFKAIPTADRTAWLTTLTFDPFKIERVAQTINDLPLLPAQNVFFILVNSGNNTPLLMVNGFLRGGNEESGREAFAPLYALGPLTNVSAVTPYKNWNTGNEFFCARGDRKPAFSSALTSMKASAWPKVLSLFAEFQKLPTAENTAIVVERYNTTAAQAWGRGATAVNDALRFDSFAQAIVIPWYRDSALDDKALAFGSKLRDIWSDVPDGRQHSVYVNFAHGDEHLSAVYGCGLARLRALKKQYDPRNVFGEWFSLA